MHTAKVYRVVSEEIIDKLLAERAPLQEEKQ